MTDAGERAKNMMLTIIIPYYNAKTYTDELLACLDKQITDEVEVIVVDDGSEVPYETEFKWCKVKRQKNQRCAGARNTGLDMASGEYIQFIDADDMIPDYFIDRLLREIRENPFDVCDYSWKSLTSAGPQHDYRLADKTGRLRNPSVCTRCFSRAYIGDNRFNTKKDSTEDEDFSRKLGYLTDSHRHTAISEYMYFYRTEVDGSKIKRFKQGLMNTKRIVYHFEHVTKDMDILDEIKKEDETNEVWLLTHQNDIPELSRYCQISSPMTMWAHELRGEPYSGICIIEKPIQAQVIVYCQHCATVGGISTVIYNFCLYLHKKYGIIVLYEEMDKLQISRISEIVGVFKYDSAKTYICDTLILNRLTDEIKPNIEYRQTVQMCHACYQINYRIPQDRDILINVSQASKDSWEEESAQGKVIHNMVHVNKGKCLMLVSATRVNTIDKGQNDQRMKKLAEKLLAAGINFVWLNFADGKLTDMPDTFINMHPRLDIHPYIQRADYLVQLSDKEAYSMSILEALCLNTAVIATPFPSLFEEGFIDGVHGHVIPYDMEFNPKILLKVPKFRFKYDNNAIIKQWTEILGDEKPRLTYRPTELVDIICIEKYHDKDLGRTIMPGEHIKVTEQRAAIICGAGFCRRV